MNLKALRSRIKNITDYSPELSAFNDQLDELVNDAYYEIWTHKRWNFTTKLGILDLHTDMTPESDTEQNGGNPVTLGVTTGDRRITFSSNMGRLAYTDVWEGQPIEIQTQEYKVSRIDSLSRILLDRPFEGNTEAADTSWKLKKRTYDLPEDCLELLYLGHRDYPYNSVQGTANIYGKSTGLLQRREEELNLRVDYATDYAEAYITMPTEHIPSGEKLDVIGSQTGLGSIPTGYYELCWAFEREGKVGPLSEPTTVYHDPEGGVGYLQLAFKTWDDQDVTSDVYQSNDQRPAQWEGYRKRLYWNRNLDRSTGERLGLPCWTTVTIGGTTRDTKNYLLPLVVPDVGAATLIQNFNQFDAGSDRYIERDGQHQKIRPYPRPIGFDRKRIEVDAITEYTRQMVIRYMRKPKDLLLATDTPDMPVEFHQLIVYRALENIYLKLGQSGLANTYQKKYNDDVKGLMKRYIDKVDSTLK